jgi:multidrug efflux pump subunit AcrA (membrane-fusion protein)
MKSLFVIIVLLVVLGGGYLLLNRNNTSTANAAAAPVSEKVVRRTVEKIVSANGKVASNRDIDIKCQASGTIKTLPYTDVSREVKPGEVLCQLDPIDMQRQLDTATAVVAADKSRIAEAEINRQIAIMNLDTSRARYEAALANAIVQANDARAKAKRTKELFDHKDDKGNPLPLASKEELDTAESTVTKADTAVKSAKVDIDELEQQKKQIDTKDQQITQMKASLAQDQARLETAQRNVDYCTVSAPTADNPADPPRWFISSLLTNIAPGYLVQSGTSGFSAGTTIMTLSDLSHVYLLASVDESDIGLIADPARGGEPQKVRITTDSFQGIPFEGRVVRVATKGVNSSNVVTFEVKIEVTSDNRTLLRPEMTGTAKIVCADRKDVLAIPAAAFTPPSRNAAPAAAGADSEKLVSASAPAPRDPAASAPASGPATGRGRGTGRGNRSGAASALTPVAKLFQPTSGTVSVVKDDKPVDREVVVGLLGTDPDDPMTGDVYEVISGLNQDESVLLKNTGSDSKWKSGEQGRGRGMTMPRGR